MILVNPQNKLYIKQIAILHKKFIDTGFLSSLGEKFLFNLYEAMTLSENSFVIIEIEDKEVAGFVSGTENLNKFYRDFLKTHFFKIILSLMPVFFSFTKLKKIIEIIFYINNKKSDIPDLPNPELLSIVVAPKNRRKKVAQKLFNKLIDEFKNRKIEKFKIIVGEKLIDAQKFYEKLGAINLGKFQLHKGEISFIYLYNIK